jgi:hypothetical protein
MPVNLAPYWLHQTVLDGRPIGGLARAFVRHHLAGHRMFHLVDLVSLVAVRFTTSPDNSFVGNGDVLTLSLSQRDAVVVLRVDDTASIASKAERTAAAVDESIGSGVFGLLTLQWGVRRIAKEARGLWATFDAHRHKQHVVATVEDGMPFPAPRAPWHDVDGHGPLGIPPGRRQSPRLESRGAGDSRNRAR